MKKLMQNKSVIALIAALMIIVAVLVIPKLTGKSLGELVSGLFGGNSQQTQSEAVSGTPQTESSTEISVEASAETSAQSSYQESREESSAPAAIAEDGAYTSKEDVALYIRIYGKLPGNFITKAQAQELGWEGGPLWDYAPGKSIGGDSFSNREGQLPKQSGRKWYECDIDYDGGKRGAKRIVFSNDGLIYYTEDHYETFTKLY